MTWSLKAPTQAMLGWETVIPLRFIMFVRQSFHELGFIIHILRSWYSGVSLSEQNAEEEKLTSSWKRICDDGDSRFLTDDDH